MIWVEDRNTNEEPVRTCGLSSGIILSLACVLDWMMIEIDVDLLIGLADWLHDLDSDSIDD